MQLADEHSAVGNYERSLYKSCLVGMYKDDPSLLKKLVRTYYQNKEYLAAIELGRQVIDDPLFIKSEERIAFAWSLYFHHEVEEAEENFKAMDLRFSNYLHRLEYARFLNMTHRPIESKQKLDELLEEIEAMDKHEQRLKKEIRGQIKQYYRELG